MNHGDFRSTENLEKNITNRKTNVECDPINGLIMRWFRIEKAEPLA